MKISTAHKKFADWINHQTALEYPERFLGPNWKDVLNFWIYLDTLSGDEVFWLINRRYHAIGDLNTLNYLSLSAAEDTIGECYTREAWCAPIGHAARCATCELIGSHNLESLTFLPLFLNI